VSDPLFDADDAATPLTADELQGLIPSHIALRRELNEAEQIGITAAETWALSRRRNVLEDAFLRQLHRRMFGSVWRWAGQYRTTPRNIGVEAAIIPTELRHLVDDVRYWLDQETWQQDEIAARFHHRLVWIHAFPNGNGRHGRLAADLLLTNLGAARFSWGSESLVTPNETRRRYVAALRAADNHDLEPLLAFVRS
jgi:Fic-DOC domain mobile mystery protein B